MLKITNPITGDEVQVAQNDFPEKMTWGEALRSCNALGSGWRLPTIEELEAMYKQLHDKGQGNFKSGPFWNRETSYWSECAVSFGFNNGKTFSHHDKNHSFYVRAVRVQTSAPISQDDSMQKLEKLFELKQKGILTEEEFNQQKAKILAGN